MCLGPYEWAAYRAVKRFMQGAHLENAVPVLGNLLDAEYRTDEFRIHSFKVGDRALGNGSFARETARGRMCMPCFGVDLFLANASGRSRSVVTSTATTGLCAPLPTWGRRRAGGTPPSTNM